MEISKEKMVPVNLRAFRYQNDILQKDVAEFLGVSIGFVSAVERGQAKLPFDKLQHLVGNDRNWETDSLFLPVGQGMQVHNDRRSISQNIEGEFNAPFNNYHGYSDEDIEREVRHRLALSEQEIRNLREEIAGLRRELAYERSLAERYLSIIERVGQPLPTSAADSGKTSEE
jgi:Helix-turn-helix.